MSAMLSEMFIVYHDQDQDSHRPYCTSVTEGQPTRQKATHRTKINKQSQGVNTQSRGVNTCREQFATDQFDGKLFSDRYLHPIPACRFQLRSLSVAFVVSGYQV